jgi:hypothetical protein
MESDQRWDEVGRSFHVEMEMDMDMVMVIEIEMVIEMQGPVVVVFERRVSDGWEEEYVPPAPASAPGPFHASARACVSSSPPYPSAVHPPTLQMV